MKMMPQPVVKAMQRRGLEKEQCEDKNGHTRLKMEDRAICTKCQALKNFHAYTEASTLYSNKYK